MSELLENLGTDFYFLFIKTRVYKKRESSPGRGGWVPAATLREVYLRVVQQGDGNASLASSSAC